GPPARRAEPGDVRRLAGLRHPACGRGAHQQHRIDPGGAGEHVSDEALVTRHAPEAGPPAARQIEVGEPEVERHPPPPLLLQPVRVDPRERSDEGALPVVDVAGGSDDGVPEDGRGAWAGRSRRAHGPTLEAAAFNAASRAGQSLAPSVRRSKISRSSAIRQNTGGRAARRRRSQVSTGASAGWTATPHDGSSTPGSAPPPASAMVGRTSTTAVVGNCLRSPAARSWAARSSERGSALNIDSTGIASQARSGSR